MDINWQIIDGDGLRHDGKLPFKSDKQFADLEKVFLLLADRMRATWFKLATTNHYAEYKKTGQGWKPVAPFWFGVAFCLFIFIILLAFIGPTLLMLIMH